MPKTRLAQSHWQSATEEEFTALWLKELAEIPPTRSSEMHLVTGLLLPVWKHLPRAASKVYRLQTDDGERIVGRLISARPTCRAFASPSISTAARRFPPKTRMRLLLPDGRPFPSRRAWLCAFRR